MEELGRGVFWLESVRSYEKKDTCPAEQVPEEMDSDMLAGDKEWQRVLCSIYRSIWSASALASFDTTSHQEAFQS
jgi:hypothetical protein